MDDLRDTILQFGKARYGREAVDQLSHALQCAALAETEDASPALVAAALLHDVGHLVDARYAEGQTNDIDRRHERVGAAYLAIRFPQSVTEPIRLHVDAKRYLCTEEPGYAETLSPASVRSLSLQGGAFSRKEADVFIRQPHAADAVRLRKWDDLAKDPRRETPSLAHFWHYVESLGESSSA